MTRLTTPAGSGVDQPEPVVEQELKADSEQRDAPHDRVAEGCADVTINTQTPTFATAPRSPLCSNEKEKKRQTRQQSTSTTIKQVVHRPPEVEIASLEYHEGKDGVAYLHEKVAGQETAHLELLGRRVLHEGRRHRPELPIRWGVVVERQQ